VHGVLQSIDLVSGAELDATVAAQCEAEALFHRSEHVHRLVRFALESPVVRLAATGPHWKEIYACTPLASGRLLEGYVDLLFRGPEGLVVVDYKTAATSDPEELDRRLAAYRYQGAAYALAVQAATSERVARVTFVFLTPDGAIERDLAGLDATMEEVRGQVAEYGEFVLD
jgi:ATP-dependent helicase/nuclease subunit A